MEKKSTIYFRTIKGIFNHAEFTPDWAKFNLGRLNNYLISSTNTDGKTEDISIPQPVLDRVPHAELKNFQALLDSLGSSVGKTSLRFTVFNIPAEEVPKIAETILETLAGYQEKTGE